LGFKCLPSRWRQAIFEIGITFGGRFVFLFPFFGMSPGGSTSCWFSSA
jgi:hypothetical protein